MSLCWDSVGKANFRSFNVLSTAYGFVVMVADFASQTLKEMLHTYLSNAILTCLLFNNGISTSEVSDLLRNSGILHFVIEFITKLFVF